MGTSEEGESSEGSKGDRKSEELAYAWQRKSHWASKDPLKTATPSTIALHCFHLGHCKGTGDTISDSELFPGKNQNLTGFAKKKKRGAPAWDRNPKGRAPCGSDYGRSNHGVIHPALPLEVRWERPEPSTSGSLPLHLQTVRIVRARPTTFLMQAACPFPPGLSRAVDTEQQALSSSADASPIPAKPNWH
jgi:hypothetical protein